MLRPIDDVVADDVALIGGDRRQLRHARERVPAHEHRQVRRRAQEVVDGDAKAVMLDAALVEIEAIDIGDTAGAVDDAVGVHSVRLAVRLEHGAELAVGALDPEHLDPGMHLDADASLSARISSTASASSAGNSRGSTSRMVTLVPARA